MSTMQGVRVEGSVTVTGPGSITDCHFRPAFRERRRLPAWLHRRLLPLVVEPTYPLVTIHDEDAA